jgi:hypothetical protein
MPLSRDSGVFLLCGQLLLRGKTPYVDFWDHKPPVVFLIDALGLASGLGRLGVWLVEALILAVGAASIGEVVRRRLGWTAAITAAVWFGVAIRAPSTYGGGNLTTVYAAGFAGAILAIALAAPAGRTWYAVAGALGGAIAMTKQSCIGVPLGFGLVLVASAFRSREERARAIAYAAGALLVPGLILGWLAAVGALDAFLDANLVYNRAYLDLSRPGFDRRYFDGWPPVAAWLVRERLAAPFLIATAAALASLFREDGATWARGAGAVVVIALAVDYELALLPQRYFTHYLHALVPSIGVGLALGAGALARRASKTPSPRARLALSGLALVPLLSTTPQLFDAWRSLATVERRPPYELSLIALLRETPAGEPIYIWGADAGLYFVSGRECPSRYIYIYPLLLPGYGTDERLGTLLAELQRRPPSVIVDTSAVDRGQVPPIALLENAQWSSARALHAWVQARYEPLPRLEGGWLVYRRVR